VEELVRCWVSRASLERWNLERFLLAIEELVEAILLSRSLHLSGTIEVYASPPYSHWITLELSFPLIIPLDHHFQQRDKALIEFPTLRLQSGVLLAPIGAGMGRQSYLDGARRTGHRYAYASRPPAFLPRGDLLSRPDPQADSRPGTASGSGQLRSSAGWGSAQCLPSGQGDAIREKEKGNKMEIRRNEQQVGRW
jgi:hypothetical protein